MSKVSRRSVLKGGVALGAVVASHQMLGNSTETTRASPKAPPPIMVSLLAAQTGVADYFILDASDKGGAVRVAMHVAVPSGINLAGITYIECLLQDASVDKITVVPWLAASRIAKLQSGTIYEHVISFETHKDVPNATKQARLDQRYRDQVIAVQEAIRQRYWAWGFERTVT